MAKFVLGRRAPRGELRLFIYFRGLDELVLDANFDHCSSDIVANNFPVIGDSKFVIIKLAKLFSFDFNSSNEDIRIEMKKDGFKPAGLLDLLAFAEQYPDTQRDFPIMAIGDIWKCLYPCLNSYEFERRLVLSKDWTRVCQFLGVK